MELKTNNTENSVLGQNRSGQKSTLAAKLCTAR